MVDEQMLLNVLIIATVLTLLGFGYIFILCESQWRFRGWISQLHACNAWKNDYIDHYRELEVDEETLIGAENAAEENILDMETIMLAEWKAESAAGSYFESLEDLDRARERLYSPVIFPMIIWQALLPWGNVSMD